MITYIDVFSSLVNKYHPDNSGWNYRGDIDTVKNLDGLSLEDGLELKFDITDVEAEKKRLQAEDKWREARKQEYPPIGDQLDMQYWDKINGTEKWKEFIEAVKKEHPKPE